MYLHVNLASDDLNIEALSQKFNKQIEKINNNMLKMQKDLEKKDSEIKLLTVKFTTFEKEEGDFKKDLEMKNANINGLEIRLEELEKEHKVYKKQQEKKLKELENLLKQKTKKVNERTIPEENSFKCRKCDYTTTSRQGLKIHNAKVHSNVNFEEFPAACDICEKVLDNESSLKKHKKTDHTFHYVKFQCIECDFMAKEEQTLHVHFGRKHSVKKQCGLCDKDLTTPNN